MLTDEFSLLVSASRFLEKGKSMERSDLRRDKHLGLVVIYYIMVVIMLPYLLLRGVFTDPEEKVRKLGVKEGQTVIDYGCGDGFLTIAAANVIGDRGRVYRL
jgi:predicted methyltransferase